MELAVEGLLIRPVCHIGGVQGAQKREVSCSKEASGAHSEGKTQELLISNHLTAPPLFVDLHLKHKLIICSMICNIFSSLFPSLAFPFFLSFLSSLW